MVFRIWKLGVYFVISSIEFFIWFCIWVLVIVVGSRVERIENRYFVSFKFFVFFVYVVKLLRSRLGFFFLFFLFKLRRVYCVRDWE